MIACQGTRQKQEDVATHTFVHPIEGRKKGPCRTLDHHQYACTRQSTLMPWLTGVQDLVQVHTAVARRNQAGSGVEGSQRTQENFHLGL